MGVKKRTVENKRVAWTDRGPGPAGYNLPPLVGRTGHAVTHMIGPEYTMRPKFPYLLRNFGPGAGHYLIPWGIKARGWDKPPAYTIRTKQEYIHKAQGPGPGKYDLVNPNVHKTRPPAFSLRGRNPLLSRYQTPGPNCYLMPPALGPKIADKTAAPEITLKSGWSKKNKTDVPAGDYDVGECDLIKPKAPAFTIRRKFDAIYKGFPGVGPSTYEPQFSKSKAAAPAWHLGSRYNDYTGLFRTDCDKSSYEPLD